MLCLTEEESEKFKKSQIESIQSEQRYNQLLLECNQSFINAIDGNPFIGINQKKLLENYNNLAIAHTKMTQDYNELVIKHNQLTSDHNELRTLGGQLIFVLILAFLAAGFGIFIKWIIKVERKMSKRDDPKPIPIKFAKRTNPKKGDRF